MFDIVYFSTFREIQRIVIKIFTKLKIQFFLFCFQPIIRSRNPLVGVVDPTGTGVVTAVAAVVTVVVDVFAGVLQNLHL